MPIIQDAMQNAQGGVPNPVATAATAPQNVPGGAAGQLPPPNPAITCPAVKAHMDDVTNMQNLMSPEQRSAFERVVVAGKKMLYAPETMQAIEQLVFDDNVPMKNKLGEGIANLVVMMDNQGNGTIPKDILIPAGVVLMFEAADYVFEAGFDVSEEDLAGGMEILTYGIFDAYGIPREKLDAVIDDMADKMGFEEGDADKVIEKVETAQEEGKVREPIPGDAEAAEEAAFAQGFNETRGV
jgi:hypothetical protein